MCDQQDLADDWPETSQPWAQSETGVRGQRERSWPSRAPSTIGTGLLRGCRRQVGWALRALPPWPLTSLGNVNGTNAPSWGWQDGGPGQKKEGGGRVAFSFQTWCSHPSGADGTGRALGIQASGQRQFSHELTLTAREPPGPLAGLSTISLAPAGQSPKSYAPSIWPTRVGSDGSEVQPRRARGPWYRPENRAQTEARRLWAPGWEKGRTGGIGGMTWVGQHFPPFLRGTNGEPRTGALEGANTDEKAAIWPTSGVPGEASSPAGAAARLKASL